MLLSFVFAKMFVAKIVAAVKIVAVMAVVNVLTGMMMKSNILSQKRIINTQEITFRKILMNGEEILDPVTTSPIRQIPVLFA